jgi:hypothetical protein
MAAFSAPTASRINLRIAARSASSATRMWISGVGAITPRPQSLASRWTRIVAAKPKPSDKGVASCDRGKKNCNFVRKLHGRFQRNISPRENRRQPIDIYRVFK